MSRRPMPRALRLAAHNADAPVDRSSRARPRLALVRQAVPVAAGGGAQPEAGSRAGAARRKPALADRRPRGLPRRGEQRSRALLTGSVVLLVALAVLAGWAALAVADARATERARAEGLAAAVTSAELLLSYDHRRVEADVAAAAKRTTGEFRTEYTDTSRTVVPMAKEYKAVVAAQVKAASVVRADADQIVTLLFVDQSTRSTRVTGTKVDQARVRMTMDRTGGTWLVAKVEAL